MNIGNLLLTIVVAFATDNIMFSYGLGINRWFFNSDSIKKILLMGGIFTSVAVLVNMANYAITYFFSSVPYMKYLQHFIILLVLLAFYVILYFSVAKLSPDAVSAFSVIIPLALYNTALFAILFITKNRNYGFLQSVLYSLGSGAGYTAAMVAIFYAKKRLYLSPIPKSFKGTPIILIYIGILSLGLFGLLGYGVTA